MTGTSSHVSEHTDGRHGGVTATLIRTASLFRVRLNRETPTLLEITIC